MPFEGELEGTVWSFSKGVLERRTSTGSDVLSLLICYETTKFVLLSVFILIGTICPKISAKPMRKNAKSPFPVDMRRLIFLIFPQFSLAPGSLSLLSIHVKLPDKGLIVVQ